MTCTNELIPDQSIIYWLRKCTAFIKNLVCNVSNQNLYYNHFIKVF